MSGTSDIIAAGFGSWSGVAKVPTLGFNGGAAPSIEVFTGVLGVSNAIAITPKAVASALISEITLTMTDTEG